MRSLASVRYFEKTCRALLLLSGAVSDEKNSLNEQVYYFNRNIQRFALSLALYMKSCSGSVSQKYNIVLRNFERCELGLARSIFRLF